VVESYPPVGAVEEAADPSVTGDVWTVDVETAAVLAGAVEVPEEVPPVAPETEVPALVEAVVAVVPDVVADDAAAPDVAADDAVAPATGRSGSVTSM
jgi:hypothetical protein